MTVRVTVWSEYRQERSDPDVRAVYPDGIHAAIAAGLREHDGFEVRTATLDEPDHGLTDAVLADTDVLTWWGHAAHDDVSDAVVERVHARVLDGMGLIVLHSGHFSKIFKRLMGTSCDLKWREDGRRERLWVSTRRTPSPTASVSRSSLPRRRCTASTSTSRPPMSWSSSAGSKVARSSAAAVPTAAVADESSISAPATRRIRPISTRPCAG
jgi:hypothetical protein